MQITLNGEAKELPAQANVTVLLEQLSLTPGQVAVERNQTIVPRSQFGQTLLCDGDQIEILHFIGGG